MPAGTEQPLPPRPAARARPVHQTAAACRRRRRYQNIPLPLPYLEPRAAAWARQRPVSTALHRGRRSTPPPAAPATGCSTPKKTRTKLLAAVEDRWAPQKLTRGSVLCSRPRASQGRRPGRRRHSQHSHTPSPTSLAPCGTRGGSLSARASPGVPPPPPMDATFAVMALEDRCGGG